MTEHPAEPTSIADTALNETFEADAPPAKTFLYAGKLLLPCVVLVAANVALGFPVSNVIGIAAVVSAVSAWLVINRRRWGNRLEIQSEHLLFSKEGKPPLRVPIRDMTAIRVRDDTLAVAWTNDADKKKSLLIGAERFRGETWRRLTRAVAALPASQPL